MLTLLEAIDILTITSPLSEGHYKLSLTCNYFSTSYNNKHILFYIYWDTINNYPVIKYLDIYYSLSMIYGECTVKDCLHKLDIDTRYSKIFYTQDNKQYNINHMIHHNINLSVCDLYNSNLVIYTNELAYSITNNIYVLTFSWIHFSVYPRKLYISQSDDVRNTYPNYNYIVILNNIWIIAEEHSYCIHVPVGTRILIHRKLDTRENTSIITDYIIEKTNDDTKWNRYQVVYLQNNYSTLSYDIDYLALFNTTPQIEGQPNEPAG